MYHKYSIFYVPSNFYVNIRFIPFYEKLFLNNEKKKIIKIERVLLLKHDKRLGREEMEILPLRLQTLFQPAITWARELSNLKIQETLQKAEELKTVKLSAILEAIDLWNTTVVHTSGSVTLSAYAPQEWIIEERSYYLAFLIAINAAWASTHKGSLVV